MQIPLLTHCLPSSLLCNYDTSSCDEHDHSHVHYNATSEHHHSLRDSASRHAKLHLARSNASCFYRDAGSSHSVSRDAARFHGDASSGHGHSGCGHGHSGSFHGHAARGDAGSRHDHSRANYSHSGRCGSRHDHSRASHSHSGPSHGHFDSAYSWRCTYTERACSQPYSHDVFICHSACTFW